MSEKLKIVEIYNITNYEEKQDPIDKFVLELELDNKEIVIYTLNSKEKELYNQGLWPEQLMKIDNVGWRATYVINYWKPLGC